MSTIRVSGNFPPSLQIRELWEHRLTLAVDFGLASSVLVAPLFMGGRGGVGRFVLIAIVAITVTLWCIRQCLAENAPWRRSTAEWFLLAGLGVLLLQLLPLPLGLLNSLSPSIAEVLPLWSSTGESAWHLGTWRQISLHPAATQGGLAIYLAYALLFWVTVQRLERVQDVERLLKLIAVATCWLAVLGLTQFLFSNGKFLWVFEHASRTTRDVVKGPFQNQNHLAHMLALGMGPLLWWLASLKGSQPAGKRGRDRTSSSWSQRTIGAAGQIQALWLACGVVAFAGLLTFSRGGVLAMLLAVSIAVILLSWKKMLDRQAMMTTLGIAVVMIVALSIYGYEPLARKLGTLRESQRIDELSYGRWALWSAHLQAIPDFWLAGAGVGTHRDIYPTYLNEQFDVEFTHGESGYLQLLLETGVLGTSFVVLGLGLVFRWVYLVLRRAQDPATVACAVAILPGLVASVFHSIADFVWYIPACVTTTVLLVAAVVRLQSEIVSQTSSDASLQKHAASTSVLLPRAAWCTLAVGGCVMGAALMSGTYPAAAAANSWNAYRRDASAASVKQATSPTSEQLATLTQHVETTVARHPQDARAHVHLAGLYLQQFDVAQQQAVNPLPLSQIRDAALASQFPSKTEQDAWLDRAVGENRHWFDRALEHARQAVRLCPLQGEGYALLASLTFLDGPQVDRKRQYLEQALKLRPYNSRVLFVAGKESALDGDIEGAMVHWKKAFHGESAVRGELIRELSTVIPPQDLIEAFAPDDTGFQALLDHYRRTGDVESGQIVAHGYIQRLTQNLRAPTQPQQAKTWERLATLHAFVGEKAEAVQAAERAVQLDSTNYSLRLQFGRLLLDAERFGEAYEQLAWCSRRRPNDTTIQRLMATAHRASLAQQPAPPSVDRR